MARDGKAGAAGCKRGATRRKAVRAAPKVAEGLTPLEYMVQVLRDESQTQTVRMNTAKSAAPYLHARLASTEFNGKGLDKVGDGLAALIKRAMEHGDGVAGLVKRR